MNNDGGPAYPTTDGAMFETQADGNSIYRVAPGCNGMSLRDYFAAAAITGLLANNMSEQFGDLMLAREAFLIADAMLQKRARIDSY